MGNLAQTSKFGLKIQNCDQNKNFFFGQHGNFSQKSIFLCGIYSVYLASVLFVARIL